MILILDSPVDFVADHLRPFLSPVFFAVIPAEMLPGFDHLNSTTTPGATAQRSHESDHEKDESDAYEVFHESSAILKALCQQTKKSGDYSIFITTSLAIFFLWSIPKKCLEIRKTYPWKKIS